VVRRAGWRSSPVGVCQQQVGRPEPAVAHMGWRKLRPAFPTSSSPAFHCLPRVGLLSVSSLRPSVLILFLPWRSAHLYSQGTFGLLRYCVMAKFCIYIRFVLFFRLWCEIELSYGDLKLHWVRRRLAIRTELQIVCFVFCMFVQSLS